MNLKTLRDTPPWDWPRDAATTFQKIMSDKSAKESDRVLAAELAGDFTVINDALAHALISIVRSADEPEELRGRAALSFGPALEHAYIHEFDDPDDITISEQTFHNIQDLLQRLYLDQSTPKKVRRQILEGSVRAPEDWHKDAISSAYASGDKDWMLTAVFSMRWVRGFDKQILEALKSADLQIHYQAIEAAGNWEVDAAWSHVVALVKNSGTPKRLLLAAIGAIGSIRPHDAVEILIDLSTSDDEDIAHAATEAIESAEGFPDDEELEGDTEHWVN